MKRKRAAAGLLVLAMALSAAVPVSAQAGVQAAAATVSAPALDAGTAAAFLDRFFKEEQQGAAASAATVTVVKNGGVIAEAGYGQSDRLSGTKVDPASTPFRVGSVSKVFTVIALMQLVDQGKIGLQDNIEKYLGGYKIKNPFGKPVTVEMLLTHTTGFEVRDPTAASILYDPSAKPLTLKESVFANFPPVVREPGTSYMYDNFASEVVGYLVQEVSGEAFNDYMNKHVFGPLGMTSSTFDPAGSLASQLPDVYDASGKKTPFYRLSPEVLPEGSMITTAKDMSRFMIAWLNGGKTADGHALLSPASVEAMSTYHVSINPDVPDMTYGFEAPAPLADANGRRIIAKGGSIPGFQSYLFLLPDEKTGVFVSAVTESDVTQQLYAAFMDAFYPGTEKFGDPGYKPQPQSELKRFEGIYSDLRLGILLNKITASGDGTLTSSNQAGLHTTLKQVGRLLFVDENGMPMAFKEDSQGNIAYLKYSNPGSYAGRLAEGTGFPDVPKDHPYATYIYSLQSLGVLTGDPAKPFGPNEPVTREAFIHGIISQFRLPPSKNKPVFKDVAKSPYAAEIQAAAELGLLSGTGNGLFEPQRVIKREEAAMITLKLLQISGYQPQKSSTKLASGTSPWAEQAVKTLIDLQMHGPEVAEQNGRYDYGSQKGLTKAEFTAIQYYLVLPEKSLIP
ncbi:serine hydrolase [Paenibacillus sp. HN-1]|uniref:serine hydrolase n=1 Tax=Paenibacillus TaxID=44249 RepID=UPI001CA882C3|nr:MULTISPECIES: serine hydrolase [Paenibacillus]MBY9077405.1 serine hydrolase [Paenibacillus sp. CGMCC 1.18879]MBY9087486.1 serine hydrolase [Paenibacillus sinensis]